MQPSFNLTEAEFPRLHLHCVPGTSATAATRELESHPRQFCSSSSPSPSLLPRQGLNFAPPRSSSAPDPCFFSFLPCAPPGVPFSLSLHLSCLLFHLKVAFLPTEEQESERFVRNFRSPLLPDAKSTHSSILPPLPRS